MPAIFAPIDIEADLDSLRSSAPIADLAYHDTEIARFVKRAIAQRLPPAVLELSGRYFPWFFPELLWDAPVWVHWLGRGFDDVIDELAHVRVQATDQYSTDCMKRRQVLSWNTGAHSFCTSPRGLVRSLNSAVDNEVPLDAPAPSGTRTVGEPGNPVHRACSNWYLIRAVQQGLGVVTEHEIASERGPCRLLKGKQADGLIVANDGACTWLECEHSAKSRPERHKTVALVQDCLGGERQVEAAPGLWLARLTVVATNEKALRWISASFLDAHRSGLLRDSQVADVDACLLPISESLVPGDALDGNMWWDVLVPAMD